MDASIADSSRSARIVAFEERTQAVAMQSDKRRDSTNRLVLAEQPERLPAARECRIASCSVALLEFCHRQMRFGLEFWILCHARYYTRLRISPVSNNEQEHR